jgi:RHS repeat-associated protein
MPIHTVSGQNFGTRLIRAALLICLQASLSVASMAQAETSTNHGGTPAGIAPGAPAGSYALSDFEQINNYNGRLSISLPLLKLGGRGAASYTAALSINARPWIITSQMYQLGRYYHSPTEYFSGMEPGYGPGVLQIRRSGDYVYQETHDQNYYYGYTLTRLTFSSSDGTEYELIDQQTGGERQSGTGIPDGYNRGRTFVTRDGTAATFVSDEDIYDRCDTYASPWWPVNGNLSLRDGTRYRVEGGLVMWVRDRNGNKITFTYDTYGRITAATDSLNRQVTFAYSVNAGYPYGVCDTITYRGFGGATRTIRISITNLSSALRSGYSTQTYAQLFPELNFAGGTSYNPNDFVSAVWLPDDRKYEFRYNSYGELARVVLPTGGAFEYDYEAGSATGPASGVVGAIDEILPVQPLPRNGIYRRLKERRVYADGSTLEGKTTCERPVVASPGHSTVIKGLDSGGAQLAASKHYFYRHPEESILYSIPSYLSPWDDGKEYQTDGLNTGLTLLRRATHIWADAALPGGPRITSTTTTLADTNQVSKQTFSYDQYNNQTDVYEYGYDSGAPGTLARRSHTDYLTTNPVNGSNYATSNNIHLRSLPSQTQVFDAGGVLRAQTSYEYDNYTADSFHNTLVARGGISGHDSAYTTTYTTRGNATQTTRYLLNVSGVVTGSLSGYAQYDVAGNMVKAIDPRSTTSNIIATIFDYADRFGAPDGEARANAGPTELGGLSAFAFPTKVTNALGHEAYTQFDYYLGRPVDSEDPNGVKSSFYYNDALDRPTKGIGGVGTGVQAQANVFYDDANKVITVARDRVSYGESASTPTPGGLVSKAYYDGLGRTFRASAYEGSTWSISVTEFDALGRVKRVTNPYRGANPDSAAASPEWTTTTYDALGRVTSVQTPDGAQVTTAYSGDLVLVTDQANKKRLSKMNALGHLTDVWEILAAADGATESVTFGTTLHGYRTQYTYSALDDLLTVTQRVGTGGTLQTRTFAYDSLKRLTSATNPESGTTSYAYDPNGNLLTKTDARNVVTTMVYDALGRPTSKTYSTTGTTALSTPTVNYYYDNQSLPSGAPSYTRGPSIGRLVATTHGGGSEGNYFGYDSQGRVVEKWQRTGTTNYRVQADYNLAGAVTAETYPSGRTVNYAFDAAGRLSSFTGRLGDGTLRTYADEISYSAAGQVKREKFGMATPLYHRKHYNKRHQLYDIRLGTSDSTLLDSENPADWQYAAGGWDRGALRLFYTSDLSDYNTTPSAANNNGNLYRADHFMPANTALTDWAMNVQAYIYDDLNRLKSVAESAQSPAGSPPAHLQQAFSYDRWGNRTIDRANTWAKDGTVWVEDALPTGAVAVGDTDGWNWVTANPTAFSGTSSHQSATLTGVHQHYFHGATQTLAPTTGEKLYAWVYLDPASPPTEVMLQWYDGSGWEHRAYWGANQIGWGTDGTASRRYAGPLPETGRWVRLEVSANSVGLEGAAVSGMAFTLYGGKATWDRAGKTAVANGGVNDKAYSVDAATNRLGVPAGQAGTISYDAAGNLTTDGYTTAGLGDHKYDAENKLREVYTNSSSLTAQYFYDGDGQRVRRLSGTQETWQVYGIGGELLAEYQATAPTTVQKEYGYRGGQLLITAEPGGNVKWVVSDHLGSTRMVVDKSGRLTDDPATTTINEATTRLDYLPFGEELGAGTGARTVAYGFSASIRQKFGAKERDDETGLDFFEVRYLAGVQGRFTSPDSFGGFISNPQTLNLYAYVQNNPLAYADPTGHFAQSPHEESPQAEEDLRRKRALAERYPCWCLRQDGNKPTPPPGYDIAVNGALTTVGGGAVVADSINISASSKAGAGGKRPGFWSRLWNGFKKILPRMSAGLGAEGSAVVAFPVFGAGGTAAGGVGIFNGSSGLQLGGYGSYGASAGPAGIASYPPLESGANGWPSAFNFHYGQYFGGGGTVWFSNATTPAELELTESTWSLNLGGVLPWFDPDLGVSVSYGRGIYHVSIDPPTPFKTGWGAGLAVMKQKTSTHAFSLLP